MNNEQGIQALKEYFIKRDDVIMAFLFGSQADQNVRTASDWDIAVYFKSEQGHVEWEERKEYRQETDVWADCTRILATDNIDLVVLNRAPASIADTALRGIILCIKDRWVWLKFMLRITALAEEYRIFVKDFYAIAERSHSLGAEDQEQLRRTLRFIEEQMGLYPTYRAFSQKEYEENPRQRNEIERWLENIINAVINISKITLGSKKVLIPVTYRETVSGAIRAFDLSDDFTGRFDQWMKVRNELAHEYLDMKWMKLSAFAQTSEPSIRAFIDAAKKFLEDAASDSVN